MSQPTYKKAFRSGEQVRHKNGRLALVIKPLGNGKAAVQWLDNFQIIAVRLDDIEPIGSGHR